MHITITVSGLRITIQHFAESVLVHNEETSETMGFVKKFLISDPPMEQAANIWMKLIHPHLMKNPLITKADYTLYNRVFMNCLFA